FLTLGIRGVLERAGLGRPVRLTLLDPDGRRVADLGTFAPQGGSWSTIPAALEPDLEREIPAAGGCGYHLEVAEGGKSGARPAGKTAKGKAGKGRKAAEAQKAEAKSAEEGEPAAKDENEEKADLAGKGERAAPGGKSAQLALCLKPWTKTPG
ncbi:MAG TPA: hypothetical protein VN783_15215, partial [Thermoanaerobaculia bacterium]|nr:hypothetical protein [Thermoanaerobaculia bacterium]